MFHRKGIIGRNPISGFRFLRGYGFIRPGLYGLIGLSLGLVLSVSLSFAEVYSYQEPDGVIHFSDTPPAGATAGTVRVESPRKIPVNTAEERPPLQERRQCGHQPMEYCNAVIDRTSQRYGLDPKLVHAVVKAESDYNPYAISHKGAMGIMQLMPETARELSVVNLFNIEQNVDGGVRYLSYLMDRFSERLEDAVAAYNAGPTAVERYRGTPPYSETREYVKRVIGYYRESGGDRQGRSAAPAIYRIVREDGSMLFTNVPADYIQTSRGEIAKEQEL